MCLPPFPNFLFLFRARTSVLKKRANYFCTITVQTAKAAATKGQRGFYFLKCNDAKIYTNRQTDRRTDRRTEIKDLYIFFFLFSSLIL